MRMWMINPALLCRKHLLGEHGEIHKFLPSFQKKHDMSKRITLKQIDPWAMQTRHDELTKELIRRGYKHNSPYTQPDLAYLYAYKHLVNIDIKANEADLATRCPECRKLINEKE